jgi:hypothetical protein
LSSIIPPHPHPCLPVGGGRQALPPPSRGEGKGEGLFKF